MSDENQVDKKSLIFAQNPNYHDNEKILKQQIIYDIDRGKYYLYDKDNFKLISTNLFGKKIPKINNAQSGKASYDERMKNQSVEKIINKIDDSLYHSRMKYFDGFTQIPRPLVTPFSNEIILQSKNDILNFVKNKKTIISIKKFQNLFNRNNDNLPDLDYYSGTIAGNILNIKNNQNKDIILKTIDEAVGDGNFNKKEIQSLKKFRNNLLINSANVINGKELNKPKEIFQKRYNINHNVMFINPVKDSSKNKDLLINLNTYRILYKSINNNSLTALKNKRYNINNLKYYNKVNHMDVNKDKNKNTVKLKIVRPKSVLNIKTNNKLFNNNNKKLNQKNNNNNQNQNKDLNNKIALPEKYEISKNETKRYDTDDDYKDIFNPNKKNKLYVSHSSNDLNLKNKIHLFIDLKKYYKNEKIHLVGYQKPYRKEMPILRKGNPKYKSTGELYKKDLEMFKIVNPDKIKLEEDENNRRMNFLKKKIEKDKIVQIVKYKHLMGKNYRINSAFPFGKDLNDI